MIADVFLLLFNKFSSDYLILNTSQLKEGVHTKGPYEAKFYDARNHGSAVKLQASLTWRKSSIYIW